MKKYIELEAAADVLCDACGNVACQNGYIPRCFFYEKMMELPAIDVAPVVHGTWSEIDASYWKWKPDGAHMIFRRRYQHADCGEICSSKKPFCPNCGARMDGDANE